MDIRTLVSYHGDVTLVKVWYDGDMSTPRKVKSLRLTQEDMEIIDELRRYYGVTSENEVIRMALRSAKRELDRSTPAPKKDSLLSP